MDNTPEYLKEKHFNIRYHIVIGLLFLVISMLYSYFIFLFILYIIFSIYSYIKANGNYSKEYNKALKYYKTSNYSNCLNTIEDMSTNYVIEDNIKIIKALCHFNLNEYQDYIKEISEVKSKESNNDLYILLNKAVSYKYLGEKQKALEVYNYLEKAFPHSPLIKESIMEIKNQN